MAVLVDCPPRDPAVGETNPSAATGEPPTSSVHTANPEPSPEHDGWERRGERHKDRDLPTGRRTRLHAAWSGRDDTYSGRRGVRAVAKRSIRGEPHTWRRALHTSGCRIHSEPTHSWLRTPRSNCDVLEWTWDAMRWKCSRTTRELPLQEPTGTRNEYPQIP